MKNHLELSPRSVQITKLRLSPQFIQTQKIIQTNIIDFANYLNRQIDENPFLEILKNSEEDNYHQNLIDSISNAGFSSNHNYNVNSRNNFIDNSLQSKPKSLTEDLLGQLSITLNSNSKENKMKYKIGETIISFLTTEGFFQKTLIPKVAKYLRTSPTEINKVLTQIQSFNPAGIAANNLQHSLLLQLDRLDTETYLNKSYITKQTISLERKIITQSFNELINNNLKAIKKKLKLNQNDLNQALKKISYLNPKPTRIYEESKNTYLVPDATIIERNGNLEVVTNREFLPNLQISYKKIEDWKKKTKQSTNEKFKQYIKEKEQQANLAIDSISFRESNLVKILKKIVNLQTNFFLYGYLFLKPCTQSKIAKELNLDIGTLSRLVNQKFVNTKWGLISIRSLFSSNLPQGKQNISSTTIKKKIEKIIYDFPNKNLSDQKITDMLIRQGYQISRRTVTKYRLSLNYLSSYRRK